MVSITQAEFEEEAKAFAAACSDASLVRPSARFSLDVNMCLLLLCIDANMYLLLLSIRRCLLCFCIWRIRVCSSNVVCVDVCIQDSHSMLSFTLSLPLSLSPTHTHTHTQTPHTNTHTHVHTVPTMGVGKPGCRRRALR